MAPVYTNVVSAKQGSTDILNVKSVQANEQLNLLRAQADGARGSIAVGELANTWQITVETEETGQDFAGIKGFANKGSFEWKGSLDSAPGTLKIFTINDMIFTGESRSTDQNNPNGVSLSAENVGNSSVLTISDPA